MVLQTYWPISKTELSFENQGPKCPGPVLVQNSKASSSRMSALESHQPIKAQTEAGPAQGPTATRGLAQVSSPAGALL